MALSEKTISKHNIRRAEVFAKYGLNTLDLNTVRPLYAGRSGSREEECILCGQQHLKYLFTLFFAAPQGLAALAKVDTGIDREGEVTLNPVGSKCIHDWIDALPETAEKLELLKRWHVEIERMKADMKAEVCRELVKKAGYESLDAVADLAAAIFRFPYDTDVQRREARAAQYALGYREARWFTNRTGRMRTGQLTKTAAARWLDDLAKARAAIETARAVAAQAPAVQPTSKMIPEVRALLDRGKAAHAQNAAALDARGLAAYLDIAQKVEQAGYFYTSTQMRYFRDLVVKMEKGS